jgi:hypothetical protein
MIKLKKRVHGRRAEDGRDGKDASRTRREHEAANQGTGFRNQVSVNSQEESLTGKSSGVRGVSDRAQRVPPSGGGARAGMMRNRAAPRQNIQHFGVRELGTRSGTYQII